MPRRVDATLAALLLVPAVLAGCRPLSLASEWREDRSESSDRLVAELTVRTPVPLVPAASATPEVLPTLTPLPTPTDPPTSTPDPFASAGRPVRMAIPRLGVDANVESVGLTADRAMDVPKAWANVGWYENGFRPGEVGNAVIAGHLDTNTGGPAVFWSLDTLQPGDEVTVTYENGDVYTFMVESSETYQHDTEGPIIERIFGGSLTPDLNLITCDGAWDHGQATYSHRLVVFTTLEPDKTVRASNVPSTYQ